MDNEAVDFKYLLNTNLIPCMLYSSVQARWYQTWQRDSDDQTPFFALTFPVATGNNHENLWASNLHAENGNLR